MAKFHIGQRVRINIPHGHIGEEKNGLETVITGPLEHDLLFGAYYPTAITDAQGKRGIVVACLAPLTDPLAEKFIASIKALGPLEQEAYEMPGPSIEFINYLLSRDLRNLP